MFNNLPLKHEDISSNPQSQASAVVCICNPRVLMGKLKVKTEKFPGRSSHRAPNWTYVVKEREKMQRATLIPFLDFLNRLLIGSKFVWNQQAQSTYGYG